MDTETGYNISADAERHADEMLLEQLDQAYSLQLREVVDARGLAWVLNELATGERIAQQQRLDAVLNAKAGGDTVKARVRTEWDGYQPSAELPGSPPTSNTAVVTPRQR